MAKNNAAKGRQGASGAVSERNNINKFRKKRAARKLWLNLGILTLIILVMILVVINWSRIIAPLKDAALDVGKGGFPVDLPGSTDYVLDGLGDNFCLLTDTYFYTYNSDGAMIANVQHGMQNPELCTNSRRALIYDRKGREFQLYSRTGEVFSASVDDTIDFAEISNDERCAVVTKSTKYSNCLYIFNGEGKQIFRWASPRLTLSTGWNSRTTTTAFTRRSAVHRTASCNTTSCGSTWTTPMEAYGRPVPGSTWCSRWNMQTMEYSLSPPAARNSWTGIPARFRRRLHLSAASRRYPAEIPGRCC